MPREDSVGYGNPPKSSQFRPGQSGNPRGRPKGSKNMRTELRKGLTRRVVAKIDGRQKRIPVMEAIVARLIHDALHGTASDRARMMQVIDKYCPDILAENTTPSTIEVLFTSPDGSPDEMKPTDEERAAMRRFLKDRRAEQKRKAEAQKDENDGWSFLE